MRCSMASSRSPTRSGAALVGGNLTRSPGPLIVDVTAIGAVRRRGILTRGGGAAGHDLYVTGHLGAAATGLAMLAAGIDRAALDDDGRACLAQVRTAGSPAAVRVDRRPDAGGVRVRWTSPMASPTRCDRSPKPAARAPCSTRPPCPIAPGARRLGDGSSGSRLGDRPRPRRRRRLRAAVCGPATAPIAPSQCRAALRQPAHHPGRSTGRRPGAVAGGGRREETPLPDGYQALRTFASGVRRADAAGFISEITNRINDLDDHEA